TVPEKVWVLAVGSWIVKLVSETWGQSGPEDRPGVSWPGRGSWLPGGPPASVLLAPPPPEQVPESGVGVASGGVASGADAASGGAAAAGGEASGAGEPGGPIGEGPGAASGAEWSRVSPAASLHPKAAPARAAKRRRAGAAGEAAEHFISSSSANPGRGDANTP